MNDATNEDLVQKVLKLIFDAAEHGMTRDEIVDATGADPKAIDKILKQLHGGRLLVRAHSTIGDPPPPPQTRPQ
jgi:hypothetical protein